MAHRNHGRHALGILEYAITRRREKERIGKLREIVKNYFDSRYYLKFNRFVGDGSHGGTGLFTADMPPPPGLSQTAASQVKFIVKFSLGINAELEDSDEHLRNEARWLRYLDGSEHFIASRNIDHLAIKKSQEISKANGAGPRVIRGDDKVNNSDGGAPPAHGALEALVSALALNTSAAGGSSSSSSDNDYTHEHRPIPFIILEYLPCGDLEQLREQMRQRWIYEGQQVPSRLLWGLALCLVRMCIGLAYHKDMKPGQREEIQPGKRPTTLAHNSLKPPNVLLDFPKPGDGEHGTTPLLKMIDFGRTSLRDGMNAALEGRYVDGAGVYSNLFYTGSVIETLAAVGTNLDRGASWIPRRGIFEWKEPVTHRVLLRTQAHPDFCRDGRIDRRLRCFVAELMSQRPEERPSLQTALDTCLMYTRNKAEDIFPSGVPYHETDDFINQYLTDVVLNAAPARESRES